MSVVSLLIQAWIIGLAVAAPVGPIGMLCIRKTLELGFVGALSVGLGAALADAVYGFVAGAGLTAISGLLLGNSLWIKLFGGVFLIYLGVKELKSSSQVSKKLNVQKKKAIKLMSTTFFLTLTNPMTILSFIGIFSSIGGKDFTFDESLWMVLGIFLGSMSWWVILGKIIQFTKGYLPSSWLERTHWLSACILILFGGWSLVSIASQV